MPPVMRPPKRGVSYSEALAKAYASNPEDEIALDTLEFLHPNFLDPDGNPMGVRVVNDEIDLTAFLEADAPLNAGEEVTFKSVGFEFQRQSENESGAPPTLNLRVNNVLRTLIPYLDEAIQSRIPITVIWRPYLVSDLSGPHMSPVISLTLSNVSGDLDSISAQAGFTNLGNRRFPASEYTSNKFPGLVIR